MKTDTQHQIDACHGNERAIELTMRIARLQAILARQNAILPRVIGAIRDLTAERAVILEQDARARMN